MQYLSDEWIEAADSALSEAWNDRSGEEEADRDLPPTTTIQYTVSGTPVGKVTYTLHAGESGAGVSPGKAEGEPDATMELDYDSAVAIAKGERAPQVAFMQGDLKLGGNVMLLVDGAARLEAVGNALGSIDDVEY